jgi:tripartite-type tricarboxylate transporter receptor subunit TctC
MQFAQSLVGFLFIATLLCCAETVSAQAYPNRPIRLLIPFSPGGSYDVVARMIAQSLGESWGQQVVVDNRPGAAGRIGAEMVAKSTPDGYTITLFGNNQTIVPSVYRSVPYDMERDFSPVTLVAEIGQVLVVHPSVPAKSVSELVALAKAKPRLLNFGSGGTGGITHLSGELLKSMAGVDIVHVPYKGSAPAMLDLLGGQMQLMLLNTLNAIPHVKSGKLRGLAATSIKRSRYMPELPTLDESGLRGYDITEWYGVLVPAKTPRNVIDKLNAELVRIISAPDTKEQLAKQAAEPVTNSPSEFAAFLKADRLKYDKIVKDAGIRPE